MSNLHKHALTEFKAAGWIDDSGYKDEMQGAICAHVMKLLDIFAEEVARKENLQMLPWKENISKGK